MKQVPENLIRGILVAFIFALSFIAAKSQSDLPKSFFIGEYQSEYDVLIGKHKDLLLTACDNSMDMASNQWIKLMLNLEAYAESRGYDIKGIKLWVNVFWDKNGQVSHFAFHPKPNSKNVDYNKLNSLITDFLIQENPISIKYKNPFSHYGSVTFPVYAKLANEK